MMNKKTDSAQTNQNADAVIEAMKANADPTRLEAVRRFFKTGKGQYAENDQFLGLTSPVFRKLMKTFAGLPLPEIRKLLDSEFHEARTFALVEMAARYHSGNEEEQAKLLAMYIEAAPTRINNWDLVDVSAPEIVGCYELAHHSGVIERFAESDILWEQRIAVVATLPLIQNNEFDLTLRLCEKFLTHRHDLMHKACGWMLREVGRRNRELLTNFLNQHRLTMPRTMLRYAIEHYPEDQRKAFMAK